ncbi:transposase [Petrimonas sp.]|uniref:transposase n=1 Tax=Petrimonas sp. TaxID=2023866 RepID=UPI002FC5B116
MSERILTGDRKAIAIDPSFISKSGKQTPWIGYFWSGTAGQAKRGLEILGIGLVDIDNKDCISLKAVQTPDSQTLESNDVNLIDWYLQVLKSEKEKLHRASHYVVADAYFSKNSFATGLKEMEFHLISRFRDIDMANLDKSRARKIEIDNGELYTLVAYSKSLKQMVRLVTGIPKRGRILNFISLPTRI